MNVPKRNAIRLELVDFPVTQVHLGTQLRYHDGILEVDPEELIALVRQDSRIPEASLAVVAPDEKTRITYARDVVEPRVKVQGQGQVFPGVLGPVVPVGDGRTHRLSGMAVIASAEYEGTIRAGTSVQRSGILDMWGPGGEVSRFSSLVNLVLILRLVPGLPEIEAHAAIQRAEYEVARRLAEVTIGVEPQQVETYDLAPADPKLPRVVFIQGCLTDSQHSHTGTSYYGLPLRESLATVIHPNELLDGAVTVDATRARGHHPTTWDWQNHPLVLGLYQQHGRRLNFLGMILERIRFEAYQGKEVAAHCSAQLAAALSADGALVTWLGSGNAFLDVMLTVRACEQRGIKTVLVTYEYGGTDGVDASLLFYTPEANAVISTGASDRWLRLPAPERVVGPSDQIHILSYPGVPMVSAWEPLTLDARDIVIGGVDIWGRQSVTCKAY